MASLFPDSLLFFQKVIRKNLLVLAGLTALVLWSWSATGAENNPPDAEYYTIQVWSFPGKIQAEEGYSRLEQALTDAMRQYLRIEKIKEYYTVRIGKFDNRQSAEPLLSRVREIVPRALIQQAYIKPERIVKIYGQLQAVGHEEPPAPTTTPPIEGPKARHETHAVTDGSKKSAGNLTLSPGTVGTGEPVELLPPEEKLGTMEEAGSKSSAPVIEELLTPEEAPVEKPAAAEAENAAEEKAEDAPAVVEESENPEEIQGSPAVAEQKPAKPEAQPTSTDFTVEVVSVLDKDDQLASLKYPSHVFYDKGMDEILLVSGGDGRIIFFGSDYFPQNSLGKGRDITAPQSVYVDEKGFLYICQDAKNNKPPRLTILNGAFFVEQEIGFGGVEELKGFIPQRLALNRDGLMYLTGNNVLGVAVLDREGKYLRMLYPSELGTQQDDEKAKRKKARQYKRRKSKQQQAVSLARDILIDSQGYIFLLSEELGKVFVYNAREEFLFTFGVKGGAAGKLSRPRGMAIDEKKRCIYVADYMRHTVLIYDYAGRFRFEFGGLGWTPGWFNFPTSLAVGRNGHLIVSDFFNHRVQVLDIKFGPDIIFPERSPTLWR